MSLKRLNLESAVFRNPPLPKISTFSLGQKRCANFGKYACLGCAYYELAQYFSKQ